MMSLFFTLGSTVHDWGWPKNGPFWTKKGQTWQACQHSKVVQKGPKGTKMVNLSVFDHQEPFWAHLDPFGPFQTRIDILLRSTSAKPYLSISGKKIICDKYMSACEDPHDSLHCLLSINICAVHVILKYFIMFLSAFVTSRGDEERQDIILKKPFYIGGEQYKQHNLFY